MKLDYWLSPRVEEAAATARMAEDAGFDGIWAAEMGNDPLQTLVPAVLATQRITVGTSIVVAFGRSPMTLAASAHELARVSHGRFVLGIGSQVKAHVEKRYSMPYGKPVGRMRDYVHALRDIWESWRSGAPLSHRSEHYTHTLMTPAFSPPQNEHEIPVALAAVGAPMTELAGEIAEGLIVHPFTTPAYFESTTLPALERGLARAGRSRGDVFTQCFVFMIADDDEREADRLEQQVREQIAFYGSTPGYRGVLESVGYGELQPELNALSKDGRWSEMPALIDDALVDALAVRGPRERLSALARERWGGRLDRVGSYFSLPSGALLAAASQAALSASSPASRDEAR